MLSTTNTLDDATRVATASGELFGRGDDLRQVAALLGAGRIVAIDGAPGVGKSALAGALVRALNRPRAFCDLSTAFGMGVATEEALHRAVLTALGGGPSPGESAASIRERLMAAVDHAVGRIVVLDNGDRLLGLEGFVDELSRWSDDVTFVVTARQQLRGSRFSTYTLRGLGPDDGAALFMERARRIRGDLRADAATIEAAEELSTMLDGIPLALELAATRVKVMSPADMVADARPKMSMLRDRAAASVRHASMEAALAWSWEILSTEEQGCLMACALFRGAFPLAGARAVCDAGGVADTLEDLIAASMLESRFEHGVVSFRMLNCVREFAEARLHEGSMGAAVGERKKAFLVEHAEALAREVSGPDGARALALLHEIRHDALEVVDAAFAEGDAVSAARLLAALRFEILFRGPFEDYTPRLARCLAESGALPVPTRAELVATLAEIETIRGDRLAALSRVEGAIEQVDRATHPRAWLTLSRMAAIVTAASQPIVAVQMLEEALEVARRAGDLFMEGRLLERIGFARTQLNDTHGAWIAFAEANEIFVARSGPLFIGESILGLGYVELRQGRLEQAMQRFRDVVELHRNAEGPRLLGAATFNLGYACQEGGSLDEARVQLQQAVETWRGTGFRGPLAAGLLRLGLVMVEMGDNDAGRGALTEAMQLAQSLGDHHNAAIAFLERSALDLSTGRPVDVARVEKMTAGIVVGADPDAFGSGVTLCAVLAIGQGRPALPWINRIEELLSLFAQDDVHVRAVVRDLRDVARSWQLVDQARNAGDGAAAGQFAARAFEMIARGTDDDVRRVWQSAHNPFVRMWSSRLFAAAAGLAGFAQSGRRTRDVLVVHRGGDWYRLHGGAAVDLSTRRPLRLILARLVEVAEREPGRGLDVDEIAAAGWPGETLNLATRRNRVYTAIRFLREMDLEDVLVTGNDGYLLSTEVALRPTDEPFSG